ncbi:MAG: hypothetical protein A2265_05070 [Bacteroidetes bacterium RIFOXYA12_FULL_33_9]|nr:MAG: hypothetical protein A2265_05070 [Bacteroidetes bacterium RIFOXYA12_FULL_33_9]
MNKILLILIALFLLSFHSYSQDIIRYVDGTETKTKIVETTKNYVIVKDVSTEVKDTIPYFEIKEIQFPNGEIIKYTDPNKKVKEYQLKNVALSIEALEIIRGVVSTDLEFFLGNKSSIVIPFGKDLHSSDLYAGIDFRYSLNKNELSNIYLGAWKLGTGNFRFFIAPGAIYMRERVEASGTTNVINRMAASLSLGTSLNLTWGFCFSTYLGVAPGMILETSDFEAIPVFRMTVGYRLTKRKN